MFNVHKTFTFDNLKSLCDEELVLLSQQGNTDATEFILEKYSNIVRSRARTYFLVGADREDVIQEGMIGLFKAIRDYNSEKQASFRSFAELCITRQIITAIKTATRQKHMPLNTYISLNRPLFDEEYETTLMDVLNEDNTTLNPEEIIINREQFVDIHLKMDELLSPFECKVLSLYLKGKTYQDIGVILSREPKAIDNALQRIKKKLEKYISNL